MGDRAILRDGRLTLIGRNEDMLKITGVRVYLSEITRALRECYPSISHVHALSLPAPPTLVRGPLIVVLYSLTPSSGPTPVYSDRELIGAVQRSVNLPPVAFLFERLFQKEFVYQPHSGKLDRQAMNRVAQRVVQRYSKELAKDSRLRESESTYFWCESESGKGDCSMDEIARGVLEALYSVLETTLVLAPEDELKALGLSSIAAVQLADLLATRGFPIPLETLFGAKTVIKLIEAVRNLKAESEKAGSSEPKVLPISKYAFTNFIIADEKRTKQVSSILCESFTFHNELNLGLEVKVDEIQTLFQLLPYEPFEHSKCSFTLSSTDDPDVVLGVEWAADHNEAVAVGIEREAEFQEAVAKMPMSMQLTLYLSKLMDGAFEHYIAEHRFQADGVTPHRWLYSYMAAVASSIVRRADGESAVIIDLIERETVRRARENGYTAIYTANTNRVTIVRPHIFNSLIQFLF